MQWIHLSKKRFRHLGNTNQERGSFTIEASLLFPVIFILMVALILISIFIFEQVVLSYIASQAAERASFYWNKNYKNPYEGEFAVEKQNIYWRLTDDRMLDRLLAVSDAFTYAEAVIHEPIVSEKRTEKKLYQLAQTIPDGINGRIIYMNSLTERKVIVQLKSPFKVPLFIQKWMGDQIAVSVSSSVTDPVESIRTIDLLRKYGEKLMEHQDQVKTFNKQKKGHSFND